MKSVVKPLSMLSVILYVAGIITTAIFLYKLPVSLMEHSSVLHMENIQELTPALSQSYLIISLAMALGLLSIVLHVVQVRSTGKENTVAVERFKAEAKADTAEEKDAAEQYDTSSLSEEILQKIKAAAASKDSADKILESALRTVCKQLEASQGAVYVAAENSQVRFIELRASFAYMKPDSHTVRYEFGEGLAGQVAKEGEAALINSVPDGYIKILSGLGQATPKHLLLVPVKSQDKVIGVVEIASFTSFNKKHKEITQQAFGMLAEHFVASSSQVDITAGALEEFEENRHNL